MSALDVAYRHPEIDCAVLTAHKTEYMLQYISASHVNNRSQSGELGTKRLRNQMYHKSAVL